MFQTFDNGKVVTAPAVTTRMVWYDLLNSPDLSGLGRSHFASHGLHIPRTVLYAVQVVAIRYGLASWDESVEVVSVIG